MIGKLKGRKVMRKRRVERRRRRVRVDK